MVKLLVFHRPINTRGCPFFPFTRFLCSPSSLALVWCAFFCRLLANRHYYGPQEDRPSQTTPLRLHITAAPPPPNDLRQFISWEAERLYHESLCNRSFVPERGFLTSNAFFNFTIQTRGWQTLCAPVTPEVAPVVREFHSNLRFRVGTTVFVRGRWVEF